jgi:ABC-type transport system involved in cytochrome c biogenesis permease subunit
MKKIFAPRILLLCGLLGMALPSIAAAQASSAPDSTTSQDSITLLPRSLGAPAVGVEDLGAFASVAVLHEGRVKPLETFARHLLLQWSGQSSYEGRPALSVLADVLFAPEKTGDYKIFRIDNPDVAEAMRITPEPHRRYSYREIEPGLHRLQTLAARADSVEETKRDVVEKEVLGTMDNIVSFLNLTRAMQYALPSPPLTIQYPETRAALGLPQQENGPPTFWELMDHAPILAQVLENIGSRPPAARSPMENEVVRLSRVMYLESQTGQSSLLRILPDTGISNSWSSPSEAIADPGRIQHLHAEIGVLAEMAMAYRTGDTREFQNQTETFNRDITALAYDKLKRTRFTLEILYDRADPLFFATVAYWVALFLCFLYFLWPRRWLYKSGWIVVLVGLACHLSSIVARILIMHRPPVTSLFETFPFVAAISIVSALFLERRSRQGIALLCASLLGVILLSIAGRYAADGDTLQMLVAVLNSNFWLSTHVVCVTTGYGAVILSGAIGHMRLIRTVFPGPSKESLKEIDRMVYGTLCFGLLFSFIGTVLGGIWADQSWGRFWGWDPKENGALLIVLWCAILLHARQWGVIRERGMAVGAVLGAVIVSLAWLGVNLLNVGLHSYGFTTGAAVKLFSYIGAEMVFLIVIFILMAVRGKRIARP